MNKRTIELLAPARDYESAVAAVNSGADAVYIGADRFSARKNAGNSVSEIEKVIAYAHGYYCRVYIALNTLLNDSELDIARRLIHDVYNSGADALIFQDPAILEMDIPPIRLHASTQFNNYDLERIKFLSDSGVDRIVLARELDLETVKKIASSVTSEIEVFVHGALCVSMSGRCYMSYAVGGRSANRGECAQPCRKLYGLYNSSGEKLGEKYLLSLKDLNRSEYLSDIIDAGVSSVKIEGRLKGPDYVRNITAYYRRRLDTILENSSGKRTSSGRCSFSFEPDPEKTFNRGFTDFGFSGSRSSMASLFTPKSIGEPLGRVTSVKDDCITIERNVKVSPGDGICFFSSSGLNGGSVYRTEGKNVFLRSNARPTLGDEIFRNSNILFSKILERPDCTVRKIAVRLVLETNKILLYDEDGNMVSRYLSDKNAMKIENRDTFRHAVERSFRKTGDSLFSTETVEIADSFNIFLRISEINDIRRDMLNELLRERHNNYPKVHAAPRKAVPYYLAEIDYSHNVINRLSESFYRKRNVKEIEFGPEKREPSDLTMMMSAYCIFREINICPGPYEKKGFYLKNENGDIFIINVDCSRCIMYISGFPAQ